jgi:eukaryotic-like serine/threonine-protein kinase
LLESQLRVHARQWTRGYLDACQARRWGPQSTELVDRRVACLDRARTALGSLARMFEVAEDATLPGLAVALQDLPSPQACADVQGLLTPVPPPPAAQVERVRQLRARLDTIRLQIAAGDYKPARVRADQIVLEARALGYRPLVAEALLVQGRATMAMDSAAAVGPLGEATRLAMEVGADRLAIEAWARRIWAEGPADRPASLVATEVMQAVAARHPEARFERALLYNNIGVTTVDQRTRARRAFEQAYHESRGVSGPGSVELINIRVNLGLNSDDPAVRETMFQSASADFTRLLGNDHPETLQAEYYWGIGEARIPRALTLFTSACQRMDQHEALIKARGLCWMQVAFLRSDLGDTAGAAAAMERAKEAAAQVSTPDFRIVKPYLLLWQGRSREAVDLFTKALEEIPPTPDEAWWRPRQRAELQTGLGRARRELGALDAALRALELSVDTLTTMVEKQPRADFQRRLGRARIELAHALLAAGRARAAREVAMQALDWLRRAEGSSTEVARLERLTADM